MGKVGFDFLWDNSRQSFSKVYWIYFCLFYYVTYAIKCEHLSKSQMSILILWLFEISCLHLTDLHTKDTVVYDITVQYINALSYFEV